MKFLGLILFLFSMQAQAHDRTGEYLPIGHNLTQTSYVFPKGKCTIGFLVAGCGVMDDLSMTTSPWLISSYNMFNLEVRKRIEDSENRATAVQIAYFKTYKTGREYTSVSDPSSPSYDPLYCLTSTGCFTGYKMEALWLYGIRTYKITEDYSLHWNLDVNYYWDDTKPFSLRRPQAVKTPWQFNVGTLHEVHLIDHYYMFGEFAILGLNEKFPALHSGVSIGYRGESWAWQFGSSATGSTQSWFATTRRDHHSDAVFRSREGIKREWTDTELREDFSVHPEIFIQYYF